MKYIACALGAMALMSLGSCSSSSSTSCCTTDSLADQLTGKTLLLDYGQMKAEVSYEADSLHWKTFDASGQPTGEASEHPLYLQLDGQRYFVTWMEADGTAVSQILDFDTDSLQAFILAPVDSTTNRMPLKLTGSIQELKK